MKTISLTDGRFDVVRELVLSGMEQHIMQQGESFAAEVDAILRNNALTVETCIDEIRQLSANYRTLIDDAKAVETYFLEERA